MNSDDFEKYSVLFEKAVLWLIGWFYRKLENE